MAYSSYASNLNSSKQSIDVLSGSMNAVDISSSWSGDAYNKQSSNVEDVLSGLKVQTQYLSSLSSALSLIDEYDNEKYNESQYQNAMYRLDPESSSYRSDYNWYVSKRNQSKEKKNNLKKQIEEYLSSITLKYEEQLKDIPATEVVNTVNVFAQVDGLSSTLTDAFDISKNISITQSLSEANMYPNFNNKSAWVTENPYSMVGLYGQCTWFAWGRFYEIYGYSPGFTGNGNQCARQLLNAHGDKFYESKTPVAGAVFSQGLGEKYGHVGIVLAVDEANDTITIQDGNYNGKTDSFAVAQNDWGTRTMSLSEFCAKRGGAIFACPKEGV